MVALANARDHLKKDRKEIKTEADVRMCNNCLKIDKSIKMICPCKKVNYCNAECQLAHWKKHEPDCSKCYSCDTMCEAGDKMVRCKVCLVAKYCNETCRDGSKDKHECVARCYQCRNSAEKLLECGGCHIPKYCSVECQRKHWISEHKTQCKMK